MNHFVTRDIKEKIFYEWRIKHRNAIDDLLLGAGEQSSASPLSWHRRERHRLTSRRRPIGDAHYRRHAAH